MTNNVSYYISKYFQDELGNIKECSINTKYSYRDSIVQILDYVSNIRNKKSNNLIISDFNEEVVNNFLIYLKNEKKLCSSTCNNRLAAIQGLFKYIQKKNLEYYDLCKEILDIKYKKDTDTIIKYLSLDEITKLFTVFNTNDKKEFRHFMIITALYESSARVQELCDLKLKNIDLKNKSITITGKGNKTRVVPVNEVLINNLEVYIKEYNIQSNDFLFKNNKGEKLTRVGIQYIVDKYINKARKKFPDLFKNEVSNHTFRHSKAVHLLEAGVNIVYIRDILGHASITTTEIYAKCSLELKQRELEKNKDNINQEISYTEEQQLDFIEWLRENI